MKRANSYLTDKQVEQIKVKLLADKERLTMRDEIDQKVDTLNTYHLDRSELSDPVDEACANVQVAHELRFKSREIFYLKKINPALEKIKEGAFGLCKDCDSEISFERLLARPTAELCINCKESAEMDEQNNFILKRSKSFGQTLTERMAR